MNDNDQADSIPAHIGFILDGNRRWAKKYGLPTYEGHLAGYNALKDVIDATSNAGVKYISFYSFSTRNWNRAESEIKGIMKLIRRLFKNDIDELVKQGYKVLVLDLEDNLPNDINELIKNAEEKSQNGKKATLAVCFNYGGQEEIVQAARSLIEQNIKPEEVTIESFSSAIDHPEVPPCDLIVRTSGEQRLSDFMLWRSAYSEFIFLDKYWPEMTSEDVADILMQYKHRSRRFGG